MNLRWRGIAFAALIAAAAVGYCFYPRWTLPRIQSAIIARDAVALEVLIEWPALRADFKVDARAFIARETVERSSSSDSGLTGVGIDANHRVRLDDGRSVGRREG